MSLRPFTVQIKGLVNVQMKRKRKKAHAEAYIHYASEHLFCSFLYLYSLLFFFILLKNKCVYNINILNLLMHIKPYMSKNLHWNRDPRMNHIVRASHWNTANIIFFKHCFPVIVEAVYHLLMLWGSVRAHACSACDRCVCRDVLHKLLLNH